MTVENEKIESGTVQTDSELTQAIDQWIERLDHLEKEKHDVQKSRATIETEEIEARRRRDNLLQPQGAKRPLALQIIDSDDGVGEGEGPGFKAHKLQKRKPRAVAFAEELESEIQAGQQNTSQLVEAVKAMGSNLAEAIHALAASTSESQVSTDTPNDSGKTSGLVPPNISERLSRLEEQGAQQDAILSQILKNVQKD